MAHSFGGHKPVADSELQSALDEMDTWTPKSARSSMAQEMMAAQSPGAVKGAGGYVYQPMDDGSIKILHDPKKKASGVVLSEGKAYDAIRKELGLGGGKAEVEPMTSANTPEANTAAMLSDAGADLATSDQPGPDTRTSERPRQYADVVREGDRVLKEKIKSNLQKKESQLAGFQAAGGTEAMLDDIVDAVLGALSGIGDLADSFPKAQGLQPTKKED